jgi:DNA repair protein RecN (Recombination protein N)
MPDSNVVLRLERLSEPHVGGLDRGEFLLERRGVALPLRSIASGGELSRLTLVLKKILRDTGGINVLVFDEVDTGVSGSVARSVGKMLRSLASTSQVICITHLPQVASLAQNHLLVEKSASGTTVRVLSDQERIDEVARMIAGARITDASRESARELISSEW